MINGIKQHGVVGKNGRIEIESELPEGTAVEIIVLVESATASSASNETDYLLSTAANRQQLLEAIESANASENLVVISPEEWNEKYRV
jgi:antitoxin YefM